MTNGLKNNPLACGLLGVIIGSGGTLGGQALLDSDFSRDHTTTITSKKDVSNFDIIPYDENGDVFITAHGKKYHSEYCYTLNRAKKIQQVNSSDAKEAGLEPCSKCQQ